jgi:hypothetical protein
VLGLLLSFALGGALLVQPLALIIWIGSEHAGRGLATFPYAAMWGAAFGLSLGLIVLLVRYLYRRVCGQRSA